MRPFMGIDKERGEDRLARLYGLTSQTSLPRMLHNNVRPSNNLIPENYADRVTMFGLCAIILAEDGFIWNMRMLGDAPLARKYGDSDEASAVRRKKWVLSSHWKVALECHSSPIAILDKLFCDSPAHDH